MSIDPRPAGARAAAALLIAMACAACSEAPRPEPAGDLLAAVPAEFAARLPANYEVVASESRPGPYRRWLLRAPGSSWIKPPPRRGGDHPHRLPSRILVDLFATMAPGIETGTPQQSMGRFTHWTIAGGAEVQLREIVTDLGWFASVEMFKPEAAPPS